MMTNEYSISLGKYELKTEWDTSSGLKWIYIYIYSHQASKLSEGNFVSLGKHYGPNSLSKSLICLISLLPNSSSEGLSMIPRFDQSELGI